MDVPLMWENYVGSWTGTNCLHDPHTGFPDESPSDLVIVSEGNAPIKMTYSWVYMGDNQTGSFEIRFDKDFNQGTLDFKDTWHTGETGIPCQGTIDPLGKMNFLGSYAAPPGPDWGWRILLYPPHTDERERLSVQMFNIEPDGTEEIAVEALYHRPV